MPISVWSVRPLRYLLAVKTIARSLCPAITPFSFPRIELLHNEYSLYPFERYKSWFVCFTLSQGWPLCQCMPHNLGHCSQYVQITNYYCMQTSLFFCYSIAWGDDFQINVALKITYLALLQYNHVPLFECNVIFHLKSTSKYLWFG